MIAAIYSIALASRRTCQKSTVAPARAGEVHLIAARGRLELRAGKQ